MVESVFDAAANFTNASFWTALDKVTARQNDNMINGMLLNSSNINHNLFAPGGTATPGLGTVGPWQNDKGNWVNW